MPVMTLQQRRIEVLKFLVKSVFAQSPCNTDADIDYHMKKKFEELGTPSGSWDLHSILDKLILEGFVRFQDREIADNGNTRVQRWYEATYEGKLHILQLESDEKEREYLEEFTNKRITSAAKKVGMQNVSQYLYDEMLKNIEKLLPYFPAFGEFTISKIHVKENDKYTFRTTIFNKVEIGEFHNFLSGYGFISKRYDIQPAGDYIQLTDTGRKLKEAGSFEKYQIILDEELALKKIENERLQNIEQHQTLHRQYITRLTLILAVCSVVAVPYYIIEISSKSKMLFTVNTITASILLLFGMIAGIIIYMLVLNNRRD